MKVVQIQNVLKAFRREGQPVKFVQHPDGRAEFIPVVPEAPVLGTDPVMEALSRGA